MRLVSLILTSCIFVYSFGCASGGSANKVSALKFSTILNFQIGETRAAEIINVLGEPASTTQKANYFIMNYDDPETGFQRFTVNINKDDSTLMSYLWMPKETERESTLDYAKKIFINARYLEQNEENKSAHMVSSDIVLYVDQKSGVTIRYDKRRDEVEAIALYHLEGRVPGSVK